MLKMMGHGGSSWIFVGSDFIPEKNNLRMDYLHVFVCTYLKINLLFISSYIVICQKIRICKM